MFIMLIREVLGAERQEYNRLVHHPLQSWEWGEFRQKTRVKVLRLGYFEGKKLIAGYQLTIHPIPCTNYTIGYLPKGPLPDQPLIDSLKKIAKQENCLFFKLEPNIAPHPQTHQFLIANGCKLGRPLFTKYTFQIDLTLSEDQLLAQMKEKTRYNVRLAQKHGVSVAEDNSPQAFETYLKLTFETTRRQKFFAHDEKYHRLMWETLSPSGIAHLLTAKYQGKILVTWILFLFNNVLYYPYGASSNEHREVMASNLIMWEAMRWGKSHEAKIFDLWGCLGPNPNPSDPWYGFHRFKEGYGAKLVEFIGTYDLIINPYLYPLYNVADNLRWLFLKLKSRLPL
ncbi:peptidoglycan bridge formation glycyltransferase FemA/FemB family protein [Candidatus Gottesmanbacteria bacterium]|nr:peptidoglycan bridge formation glycyltransferase FemA/FemB family protein [Candidatus Gottesmanbacteria bacterium]